MNFSIDRILAATPETPKVRLGEMLVSSGKLSIRDLDRALAAQVEMGGLLGTVLSRLGLVSELDVARAISEQLGLPLLLADQFPAITPEVPGLLLDFTRAHGILPIRQDDHGLTVAMVAPQDRKSVV